MRTLSIKNLYDIKHDLFAFDGDWREVMGEPEKCGAWLIWGNEKNGKTRFAIKLADYLSEFERVLYVSAEEGFGAPFVSACQWAELQPGKVGLNFTEYESIEDLKLRLKKRKAPKIVFLDNITIYVDELKNGVFRQLLKEFPNVLFIFLAHEDRNEPATATAKLCKKLAKIIVHIQGMVAFVEGRCPGGKLIIDEAEAAILHGEAIHNQYS